RGHSCGVERWGEVIVRVVINFVGAGGCSAVCWVSGWEGECPFSTSVSPLPASGSVGSGNGCTVLEAGSAGGSGVSAGKGNGEADSVCGIGSEWGFSPLASAVSRRMAL